MIKGRYLCHGETFDLKDFQWSPNSTQGSTFDIFVMNEIQLKVKKHIEAKKIAREKGSR